MSIRQVLLLASLFLLLALAVAACSSASTSSSSTRSAEPSAAEIARGSTLYVDYGCMQCHGLGGRGRTALAVSGPSLTSNEFKKAFPKETRFDTALVNSIRNGAIIEEGRAASMPAWNGILSDQDVQEIVSYIRAGLPDQGVTIPRVGTGEEIYNAFACVKCHGQPGTGGMRNVAATTPEHQTIPAIGGPEFKKRLDSIDKVRNVVLYGRIVENGRPGVVYMPAWGKIGTADQIEKVLEYIWNYKAPGS
ncbi:MAG: c-type cytochrome [Chloroflexi bacterium]|nr:c-type cytochrome [Chloroflexota bacterium]